MPSDQDIRNQLEQLQLLRENVQFFRRQALAHGGLAAAPVATQRGLASAYAEIARCKAVLRGWEVLVEDLPDDVQAAVGPASASGVFQLRAPVPDFVGRGAELERLVAALRPGQGGRAAAISGVRGMGGLGKTELAYAAAARLAGDYSDGQILLELAGASVAPLSPAQALQQVIRAFRPEEQLPEELPALQKLYRSALGGRKVLMLADDARDAAQVRPLLPPAGCALLVTSRQRFILDGMIPIDLERLEEGAAVALLRSICPRLTEGQAQRIARLCGHLPLALRVSAGILLNDPALSPERYLTRLAAQPLAELRDPDDPARDVGAILRLSYAILDAPTQAVFRRLGVLAADADLALIAALLELSEDQADDVLRTLLRRSLIEYDPLRNRWDMHDLVRACALKLLVEAGEERVTQLRYANQVITLIDQANRLYLDGGSTRQTGLTRFNRERVHLENIQRWLLFEPSAPDIDALTVDCWGTLSEAELAHYESQLGYKLERLLREESPIFPRVAQASSEAWGLLMLGNTYQEGTELHRAIELYKQALIIFRELSHRPGEGRSLGNLANALAALDQPAEADACYAQSLAIHHELGDQSEAARTRWAYGQFLVRQGERERGIALMGECVAVEQQIGHAQAAEYAALVEQLRADGAQSG